MKKLLEQRTHLGATKLYFEQQKQQQLRHKMHNNIRAGYNVEQQATQGAGAGSVCCNDNHNMAVSA